MSKFTIDVQRSASAAGPDDAHAIAIRSGEIVFTRLLRPGNELPDDYLRAPPSNLAFWLVDNWWRLRHECVPPGTLSSKWRLAHDLASIGGGYIWPRLRIWGEGQRVGLACRSDPPGVVGPVRYITDELLFIAGAEFEDSTDAFLQMVADETRGFGSDRSALRAQINALRTERHDTEFAAWRRLEAQLGFDPDDAPEPLMNALGELSARYGKQGIEEAVQAFPGTRAVRVLDREIEVARAAGVECDFSSVINAVSWKRDDIEEAPWRQAERSVERLRESLNIDSEPMNNRDLAALAQMKPDILEAAPPDSDLKYGLRLRNSKGSGNKLTLRTRGTTNRRFELGRAIGDIIWGNSDSLGPLARSRTARQKFQRAFSQTLLCPFEPLMSYIGTSDPSDEDITAAAQHFNVSERVVTTTLVNKNVIERKRLEDLIEAA